MINEERLTQIFSGTEGIIAAYFFGSQVKGKTDIFSDYDFAVLLEAGWEEDKRLAFVGDLLLTHRDTNPSWVQIDHRTLPISFSVPEDKTEPVRFVYWTFGMVRHADNSGAQLYYWGNRLVQYDLRGHAVEFGFMWLTPEFRRVDGEWLQELAVGIESPEVVSRLFHSAFLTSQDNARLTELRYLVVDGRPAHRFDGHYVNDGEVSGQVTILVIPFAGEGALLGSFRKARAKPGEVDGVFKRVVNSLKIDAEALVLLR